MSSRSLGSALIKIIRQIFFINETEKSKYYFCVLKGRLNGFSKFFIFSFSVFNLATFYVSSTLAMESCKNITMAPEGDLTQLIKDFPLCEWNITVPAGFLVLLTPQYLTSSSYYRGLQVSTNKSLFL